MRKGEAKIKAAFPLVLVSSLGPFALLVPPLSFRSLSLSNSLIHTFTSRRSPRNSLFTSKFILEVEVRSVYISPPPYLAPAGLVTGRVAAKYLGQNHAENIPTKTVQIPITVTGKNLGQNPGENIPTRTAQMKIRVTGEGLGPGQGRSRGGNIRMKKVRVRNRRRGVKARRRRKRKERKRREERKSKSKKRRREKEKKKKKDKKDKVKKGAVTEWGKYGIIHETDMWNKRPEFTAWLAEVKQVNLESLPNWEEKQMFKQFMEDHNTATFPSKKYYSLDAYHRREIEKAMKKGTVKASKSERVVFDDEEQRRRELQQEREKRKEAEVEALKRSMQSGMAQAMKEQAILREEMNYLFKIGNVE
nr:vicilin-like seed storage protein At2g18540 [Tanacetum cinerariifolium]